MRYYRHNTEKIIYVITDDPNVTRKTHKGKFSGWTISSSIKITYAENPTIDLKTGLLTKPTTRAAVTHYDTRDSRDEALRDYYIRWAPRDSTSITEGEYRQLYQEYSQTKSIPKRPMK